MGTQCTKPVACCGKQAIELQGGSALLDQKRLVQEHRVSLRDEYELSQGCLIFRGNGETYTRAKHRKSGQWRLLKQPHKRDAADTERWKDSLEALQRCDHPHISKLYENFAGEMCQVMELSFGKSLGSVCTGSLSEDVAGLLTRQMTSAIGHLHGHGICHLELCPQSFMFTKLLPSNPPIPEMSLKLVDVGRCAKIGSTALKVVAIEKYVRSYGAFGSASAPRAPELQLSGLRPYALDGLACDIWAIGALAYMLLTGTWPIITKDSLKPPEARAKALWTGISSSGRAFVEDCLLPASPEQRPTASALLERNPWMAAAHLAYTRALQAEEAAQQNKKNTLGAITVTEDRIVQAFQEMASMDALQRAIITAAVHRLPDEKTSYLRRIFEKFDTDGNGTLSVTELVQGLGEATASLGTREECRRVLEQLDTNGSRSIDYTEFLAATFSCRQAFRDEICDATFALFDEDGSGHISLAEVVATVGLQKDGLKTRDIKKLVAKYDMDGDELISAAEFSRLLRGPGDETTRTRVEPRMSSKVSNGKLSQLSQSSKTTASTKSNATVATIDTKMTTVSTAASTQIGIACYELTSPVTPAVYSLRSSDEHPPVYTSHMSKNSTSSAISAGKAFAKHVTGRLRRALSGNSLGSVGSGKGAINKLREKGARVKQTTKTTLAQGAEFVASKVKRVRKSKSDKEPLRKEPQRRSS